MTAYYYYYNMYTASPPNTIWKNDSSESDEALDRLKRHGYREDMIYKVRGVRDHLIEELNDPRPSRRVVNGCTIAPFITMVKVEALRTGHDFTALFKAKYGPGVILENALKDIVQLYTDGGPNCHSNVDKAAKLRWAELVNQKKPMRIPEVRPGEFDASGEEGETVIDSLDPVSQFFIMWRCGGCMGPDENGVSTVGRRIKAESRTCFIIGDVKDFDDIENGIIRYSTYGPYAVCNDCNQGYTLDSIYFPESTWVLVFEGLAPPHFLKGNQLKMDYRMKMGGVHWKKAYASFGFGPGAVGVIPGTEIPTGRYTQGGTCGHGLSIQFIKGVAYLQNDGVADGELVPWPYSKPAFHPCYCNRIVYIRSPPVKEKVHPEYNPVVNERMPTSYVSLPAYLPYVFPPQPHITYQTPMTVNVCPNFIRPAPAPNVYPNSMPNVCPNLVRPNLIPSAPYPAVAPVAPYFSFLPPYIPLQQPSQQPPRFQQPFPVQRPWQRPQLWQPQPSQPLSMPGGSRFGNPHLYTGPNSMRRP